MRIQKILFFIALILLVVLLSGAGGPASAASLEWDYPTTNADGTALGDLSRFIIYQNGIEVDRVDATTAAPTTATPPGTWTIPALPDGTYDFFVTALDTSSNQSDLSNVVTIKKNTAPSVPGNLRLKNVGLNTN